MLVKVAAKALHSLAGSVGRMLLRREGVEVGPGLILHGIPICTLATGSRMRLGKNVVLCSWSRYTALGIAHPTILRTLLAGAEIVVGDDVGMSGVTICAARRVEIGARCLLGANAAIVDTDFHSIDPKGRRHAPLASAEHAPVRIGDDVFIGANVLVLKGAVIGDNSVIGAGSVVHGSIPPNVIAAGNPCRVIRELPMHTEASPIDRREAALVS